MADHHHRHHHRPHRLSVPPRVATPTSVATTSRPYPVYPSYPPSTPTPTPSKHRLSSLSSLSHAHRASNKGSLSFLFLLLFSLRSLYSLLPFLRSSPSFSFFPFSFLVSLLSFFLTLAFSLFASPSSSKDPFQQQKQKNQPIFSLSLITQSQRRLLVAKSLLLAVVFLLRFQALRYCGAAALILAELSGNVAARFVAEGRKSNFGNRDRNGLCKFRGFIALFIGLLFLSFSWDRIECFPMSASNIGKGGLSLFPKENCLRVWPMLLPFLSGFLGCYERVSMNWGTIRQLGGQRVRLISLFFTTVVLFIPAVMSILMLDAEGDGISFANLGWPLANTVVFGVLLSENYSDEKLVSSKDFQKEFLVTFLCTLVLELFYFPELSLWGLLLCGLLLWIAVRELDPVNSSYIELGSDSSEPIATSLMKPIRHILSERKSRKIALFLLINTGYMVVEFFAGFMSNSLGLISDACHMLFDCAALAIGLYASYISRLPANNQFNYGRGRFEVLSGYVNAVLLVLVGALIVLESFERILDPQEISTNSLLTVSIGGLLVNVVGLIFFHEEHHHAHGGSGSCSHSHSHHQHHDHHHHSHDHGGHTHEVNSEHQECISVSHDCHEKSCIQHDNLHSDHHEHHDCNHSDHHEHHDCNDQSHSNIFSEDQKLVNTECRHQHHDHHADVHQHGHHGNHHQADHHHHHHHHRTDHHLCGNTSGNSKSLHSLEVPTGGDPLTQGGDLHNYPHSSAFNIHSSSGNCNSQHKKLSSDRKSPKESHKRNHHHIDHNMEGIFLHVLADTMGSVGVVISTLLIKYKGWLVADPACSIFISVLIVSSVIPLLRNSAEILLQRIPRVHELDLKEAVDDVMKIKGVCGVQNLHVWSFTNTDVVGTLHLHISKETDKASAKAQASHILSDAGIKDLTLQVECVRSN
ncbi:uncharacterized protein LOC131168395 [Malania oleifera]|uniref:uncharacterized protein LOC131168395 n=1 Tax=Malania oleifera TaxID=397392 RepID=UPI0025AE1026|nr:uncharacterized protein LOC131168395 [Malania oleifera]